MDGSEGSSLSFVEEEESSACSNRTGIDVSVPNISTRFDVDGGDGVDSVFIVFLIQEFCQFMAISFILCRTLDFICVLLF